jgi:hypothetical protein
MIGAFLKKRFLKKNNLKKLTMRKQKKENNITSNARK